MNIAFVVEAYPDSSQARLAPWVYCAKELTSRGIHVSTFHRFEDAWRFFDAMILMVWLDWENREHFKAERILPVMEKYSAYRAAFPGTLQIVVNHTDMCRRAYATPYWRLGDPILFRTPAYDRAELAPFPAEDIFSYEIIWGEECFHAAPIKYAAGFVGTPSGPRGYRETVALETSKVGLGACVTQRIPNTQYNELMSSCQIIVCPQGWGESSSRHWDAWRSGKPILTDRACDSVEMIPGLRLRERVHYLVYDDPAEIPDIVSDWTKPERADDLAEIALNGRKAALSYDPGKRIVEFFQRLECA
ncbi:MAG TPA: hypothetical protein VIX59_21580 [Candidatus Binataceae bacterium]